MGEGLHIHCRKCGYDAEAYTGIGMLYFEACSRLAGEIREGKHGEELKSFFENNGNAVVNAENNLYECCKCKRLHDDVCMDVYLLGPGDDAGSMPYDYFKGKKPAVRAVHICPDCGGKMRKRNPESIMRKIFTGEYRCPCCGEAIPADSADMYLWD